MSEYLGNRGRKLLGEVITMLESEWDYCPEVEELKKSSKNFSGVKNE